MHVFCTFFHVFSFFLDNINDSMFSEKCALFILPVIQNMKMLDFMQKTTVLFLRQYTYWVFSVFTGKCVFYLIDIICNFQNKRIFNSFLHPSINGKYYKKYKNLYNSHLSDICEDNTIQKYQLLFTKLSKSRNHVIEKT